jgi:hypothetical protein
MCRDRGVKALTAIGYTGLSLCGVPQWWHMLATGDAAGVSLWFLLGYVASLSALQIAFALGCMGRALVVGNAVGLVNALFSLAAYWWIAGGVM